MSNSIRIDTRALKKFAETAQKKLDKADIDSVINQCAHVIADYLMDVTKGRTPVRTGTLRRGWHVEVSKISNGYRIVLANNVEYAKYVEYGHKVVSPKTGKPTGKFVEGRHMMEISVKEIEGKAPAMLEKYVQKKLDEVFG